MLHSSSAAFADEADIAAAVTTFSIRPLDPTLLRPKAARLLGLAPMPLATKHTKETNDGCDARGPDVSPSKWVPDWPEPDAEYVANMMRRRTPPQPQSQSFHHEALNMENSDDPLVVWQQPARLPALAGVPRGAGNGWMRVQGLQPPYDPLFILQWTASLLLTGTYAALIRPLTESMPAISLAALNPPPPALDMCGVVVLALAHGLSIAASTIDTQAAEVTARSVTRDLYYQQTWGIPVVDSTSTCRVCLVPVKPTTRHCKRCNKCVAGLDHHCRWLNNCVGSRNYWIFFASLLAAFLALLFVLYKAAFLLCIAALDEPLFDHMVHSFRGLVEQSIRRAEHVALSSSAIAAVCVLAVYAVTAAAGLVSVAMLLSLHVRLCAMRLTTFEYAAVKQKQKQLDDGDQGGMNEVVALSDFVQQSSFVPSSPSSTTSATVDSVGPLLPGLPPLRRQTAFVLRLVTLPYRGIVNLWQHASDTVRNAKPQARYKQLDDIA